MQTFVLRPTLPFIAQRGGKLRHREALIIYHPIKAIIDPVDFWGRADKKGTAIFAGRGITVAVNPERVVTVSIPHSTKAIKVAVSPRWAKVAALPVPFAIGAPIKKSKRYLRVAVKYSVKNGVVRKRGHPIKIPRTNHIRPGRNGGLLFSTRKRAPTRRKAH